MKSNIAQIGEMRLEKVLLRDKRENPQKVCSLLKSEIGGILKNYMEVSSLCIEFDIVGGEYVLTLQAKAKHLKNINALP